MSYKDGVLLEDLYDQNKLTIELVQTVIENQAQDHELLEQIRTVVEDVSPMKATVIDHDAEIKQHAARLNVLEMPARA